MVLGAWSFPALRETAVAETKRRCFEANGFVIAGQFLDSEQVALLRERVHALFRGQFETGNEPDGLYWREGTSYPHLPRHLTNGWKCDLTLARLALSAELGRVAAELMGWDGVRLGQDTVWVKPPNWGEGEFHRDRLAFLDPPDTVTCWITLDATSRGRGSLQYARGSHRWPDPTAAEARDPPSRRRMLASAAAAGVAEVDLAVVEEPAGTLVFHNGNVWHGSEANLTSDFARHSIGIHFLPVVARFGNQRPGYIYGRYKLIDSADLDESFFPVVWTRSGYRTFAIDRYCATGELG